MKLQYYIGVVLMALSLVSCKKYLEEEPTVQTDIKTVDQLRALLDNVTSGPAISTEGHNATLAYSSDDAEIPLNMYAANTASVGITNLYHYVFDVDNVVSASGDALWTQEYRKIFNANTALSYIDQVTGSEEAKNSVRADAYFIRAYSYWTLVNYYCLPYAPENMQTAGVPLKQTTSYTESLVRSTLKQTYDFILADIEKARTYAVYSDVQASLRWRVSTKAVDAFLSRYYLFTGDYAKCIQYANSALSTATAALVDFNTIVAGYSYTLSNPAATLTYSELDAWTASKFMYWNELLYARFSYSSSQLYLPSASLRSLYDQSNDLRFKWFFIKDGARYFGTTATGTYSYNVFNTGRYVFNGPTIAEMLLNKAEASVRSGDVSTAMDAVNTLRMGSRP